MLLLFPLLTLLFSRRPNPNTYIYIYTTTPRYFVVVAVLSFSLVCSFQSALVFYSLCVQFVRIFLHFIPPKKGLKEYYTHGRRQRQQRVALRTTDTRHQNRNYTNKNKKKMAKGATKAGAVLVRLVSTLDTGFFYVKRKNPKKMPNALEFRKYDPRARKHCLFVESKKQK